MRHRLSFPRRTHRRWLALAWALGLGPVLDPGVARGASAEGGSQPPQTRGLSTVRTADGETVELYEQSHALLIGMSKYRSGWRVLPGVELDVVAVRDVLQAHGSPCRSSAI